MITIHAKTYTDNVIHLCQILGSTTKVLSMIAFMKNLYRE